MAIAEFFRLHVVYVVLVHKRNRVPSPGRPRAFSARARTPTRARGARTPRPARRTSCPFSSSASVRRGFFPTPAGPGPAFPPGNPARPARDTNSGAAEYAIAAPAVNATECPRLLTTCSRRAGQTRDPAQRRAERQHLQRPKRDPAVPPGSALMAEKAAIAPNAPKMASLPPAPREVLASSAATARTPAVEEQTYTARKGPVPSHAPSPRRP